MAILVSQASSHCQWAARRSNKCMHHALASQRYQHRPWPAWTSLPLSNLPTQVTSCFLIVPFNEMLQNCLCIMRHAFNSYSASHDNWCTVTLWNRIMTAQCEGMGEVGSGRYEPALLPPCPSIRVLSYINCQRSTHSSRRAWQCKYDDGSACTTRSLRFQ